MTKFSGTFQGQTSGGGGGGSSALPIILVILALALVAPTAGAAATVAAGALATALQIAAYVTGAGAGIIVCTYFGLRARDRRRAERFHEHALQVARARQAKGLTNQVNAELAPHAGRVIRGTEPRKKLSRVRAEATRLDR